MTSRIHIIMIHIFPCDIYAKWSIPSGLFSQCLIHSTVRQLMLSSDSLEIKFTHSLLFLCKLKFITGINNSGWFSHVVQPCYIRNRRFVLIVFHAHCPGRPFCLVAKSTQIKHNHTSLSFMFHCTCFTLLPNVLLLVLGALYLGN